MPDYREMYLQLFRSCTKAIEVLSRAQLETEELYMSAEEPILELFDKPEKEH